jgi:hypothetical protein
MTKRGIRRTPILYAVQIGQWDCQTKLAACSEQLAVQKEAWFTISHIKSRGVRRTSNRA